MNTSSSSIQDLFPQKDAAKQPAPFEEKIDTFRLGSVEVETQQRAQLLGMQYVNLSEFPIGPEILGIVAEETARAQRIIPFFQLDNSIRIGVVHPDAPGLHNVLAQLQNEHHGSNFTLYLISQHSFDQAVRLYKGVVKVKPVSYGVRITAAQLKRYQKEITTHAELEKRLPTVNMTEAFGMIVSLALTQRSSDVHIEAEEVDGVIRYRIDGMLTDAARIPRKMLAQLVNRVKSIAGMKLNVTHVPQDGRITIQFGKEDTLDIRVSALPSAFGESIVLRLLRAATVGLALDELGMRAPVKAKLQQEMAKPNGMILTTGPTGSGKTTTLYAVLNTLNTPETKIITLENPVEYKLKGIVQSQIDEEKHYSFADGLRSILRQDPDIIMVGEIRDLETAQTAIDAALTGHLMLSTIHTNDAAGVIPRLMGMGVQGIFLAPSLNAIIGQRLVRRVCEACTEAYTPPQEELQKARAWVERIPQNSGEQKPDLAVVTWHRGRGCEACNNTGYKGRIGVYELFTMSAEVEKQILSGSVSEYQMKEILFRAGMLTMGQDGVLKAVAGITTLDEVFRVTKE